MDSVFGVQISSSPEAYWNLLSLRLILIHNIKAEPMASINPLNV